MTQLTGLAQLTLRPQLVGCLFGNSCRWCRASFIEPDHGWFNDSLARMWYDSLSAPVLQEPLMEMLEKTVVAVKKGGKSIIHCHCSKSQKLEVKIGQVCYESVRST